MKPNLQEIAKQALETWKQLGLNQRISVVLATGAVLVGLLSLALWSKRIDYGMLYSRIDDAEASKVIAALDADKVPYKIGKGGSIWVPSERTAQIRMQMAGKGLGKGDIVGGTGFEILDKPNFGISDFLQRANYLRAVQGELARTIGQLDDVEAARVMVVMSSGNLVVDQTRKPTASVFVKVKGQGALSASAVNSIRFLVANSVEGLLPTAVSVVDNRGNTLGDTTEPDSVAGLTASQLAIRRQTELYLSKKAESMLEGVLGPGRAMVRVSAELSFDTMTKTQEVYDPDGVIREDSTREEKTDSLSGTPAASQGVGATINTASNTNSATGGGPVNNSKNSSTTKTKKYEVGRTTSSLTQQPGAIRRLSAAVFIAKRFDGAGADRKEVALSPKEKESLTKIVKSALGIQDGTEAQRQDEITLEEWSFNDQPAQQIELQMRTQERQNLWLGVGRSLLFPLMGIAVLVLFFRAIKRTPLDTIPLGIPLSQLQSGANGQRAGMGNGRGGFGGGNGKNGGWLDEDGGSVVTVEVLNQLIKENPANMTQSIRSWLTRGKS